MITYKEALSRILARTAPLPATRVRLADSIGHVLAAPLSARSDLPRFDQSAVDGFGLRVKDLRSSGSVPPRLPVAGTVRAGGAPRRGLPAASAVKVLTGAKLPRGVDAVVMQEFCREHDGVVDVDREVAVGDNIRRKGEELNKGDVVLPEGTPITPPVVGALAAFGHTTVRVHRKPRVALVATGDELVAPGRKLQGTQIYDSNSPAMAAALASLGIETFRTHHVPDNPAALTRTLKRALAENDVVVTAGGVSVGEYDFVKDVMAALGVTTVYWRMTIKPGKPNYFGTFGRRRRGARTVPGVLVFGLPGNPVAVLLSLHQLVKPALLSLMGRKSVLPTAMSAILGSPMKKKAGRMEWVRGVLSRKGGALVVVPLEAQGSHMLSGLARANCIIEFPRTATALAKGRTVAVTPLCWAE